MDFLLRPSTDVRIVFASERPQPHKVLVRVADETLDGRVCEAMLVVPSELGVVVLPSPDGSSVTVELLP